MNSSNHHIVVTGVAAIKPLEVRNNYQVDLNMEVDGVERVVSIDIAKYEKRHAYNIKNMRDLIGCNREAEDKLRTAAAYAFSGEFTTPMVIS